MDLELAIAVLALGAMYWMNYYIGHKPINPIHIGHLFRANKKSRQ